MRPVIGIAAAALLGLLAALDFYQLGRQSAAGEGDPYKIARQEERFQSCRSAIPPGEVVGYLSDQDPGAAGGSAMFFGAQYAFAPAALTTALESRRPRLALGNFASPADWAAVGARQGYRVVKDCGQGVILYERGGGGR